MSEITTKVLDQKVLDTILAAIREINYGEIMITIHNSKIVQIEKREKRRFAGEGGT